MGKQYEDYLDGLRIQKHKWGEEAKRKGVAVCTKCGRPSSTSTGTCHVGPVVCQSCMSERMRIRG